MALSDAVLEIADQMEEDAKRTGDAMAQHVLGSYVRQLRSVVKAAEHIGPQTIPLAASALQPFTMLTAEMQHQIEIAKAREEFREQKAKHSTQDKLGPCAKDLVGGASDGDTLTVPSNMEVGGWTPVMGEVYTLHADGKLYYDTEKTREYHGAAPRIITPEHADAPAS